MLNRERANAILSKYATTKLYEVNLPVLLGGYRTFSKPFTFKARGDIMGIINARAYRQRTSNLMKDVISKFKSSLNHSN